MSINMADHPADMSPEELEKHRRECEARERLKRTGGVSYKVDELIKRIAEKRGAKAAEMLRGDMREQYRLQKAKNKGDGSV